MIVFVLCLETSLIKSLNLSELHKIFVVIIFIVVVVVVVVVVVALQL